MYTPVVLIKNFTSHNDEPDFDFMSSENEEKQFFDNDQMITD